VKVCWKEAKMWDSLRFLYRSSFLDICAWMMVSQTALDLGTWVYAPHCASASGSSMRSYPLNFGDRVKP
jgi:hypothetical protein